MNIFLFAASLRKDSCNKKLIRIVNDIVKKNHQTHLADFAEFDLPLYNADIQNTVGFPENMKKFITYLKNSDALIISSPEYNYSSPGTLKNLIDWVSRDQPQPWKKRQILLISASPSLVGGNRGLWHTRVPLECCGAFVYPEMFSLANAYEAFDEQGQLKDANSYDRMEKNIIAFLQSIRA